MDGRTSTLTADEFHARLSAAWPQFIQFALSLPVKNKQAVADKVTGRVVHLKAGERIQFTSLRGTQQTHANYTFDAALEECISQFAHQFQRLHLFTTENDIVVKRDRAGLFQWHPSAPTKAATEAAHDRRKQYLIPENQPCQFLIEIGVMNREGKVLAAKYHKFRQINRFLELVDDLLPHLPADREIQVVDFGSGKSYLTFALHHLLTNIRGRQARIIGVDRKAEVVRECSRIAAELSCQGLTFEHHDISEFAGAQQVDLMVSLHACDTATDAALAQAVKWGTPVILAVPCCQHEMAASFQPDPALEAISAHGILKERFAALATDALRANLLELCGYQTQVIEFIDLEHTPKNLLIRAVRQEMTESRQAEMVVRYQQLLRMLGAAPPYLARALQGYLPVAHS